MSNSLQIPRSIAMLSDRVNVHLSKFEQSHRDDFSYQLVKEGFRIQRFYLIFERRPYQGWNYYPNSSDNWGKRPSLGSIRLSPLSGSMTELVMEDSSSLEIDPEYLFCSAFNTEGWERDSDREQATKIATARFEVFRSMHQEVRDHVINGLKDDGILLGTQQIATLKSAATPYVSKSRIAEIRQLRSADFDLRRLIRLCEELNRCFGANFFFATAALVRTIINHVPPIFGAKTFAEVANNVGGKSVKKSFLRLETASRDISNDLLHQQIQKREVLPTAIQVDFKNELDVLWAKAFVD